MAKPRQKASGKWEIALRHPSLPGGRKYFTFDTEAEAIAYDQQWRLMKGAGISPPAEMMDNQMGYENVRLARVLGEWSDSGLAAPTQILTLSTVNREVGTVKLMDTNYKWLLGYVQMLKVKNNLSPQSIKHRVQALGRSIDEYLRNHPLVAIQNPVKLLPKGYSTYTDLDKKMVEAEGGAAKVNVMRDRRLLPGEEEKIVRVLSGYQRPDRSRGLELLGGDALLTLFKLIVNTGLRLREAYTLRRNQVDLDRKVIRAQSTKQWRGKVAFRDVPMRPEVFKDLTAYLANRPMLPGAWLFPFMEEEGAERIAIVSNRLSFRFRIAFEYMEIKDLHEHDLRHEATCRWLELRDAKGNYLFRLEELNKIMGWAPGSIMAQRYASFRAEDLAAKLWAVEEAQAAVAASV